ncbi:glycosyltransferase family 39 protein, partial [Winogradskyella sp.]|uniref:glycosyltransferase family 39 protein n=1 Tax=Winogradskyella sp. TaxID=1883156 RepID=UPI0025EE2C46
MTKLFKLYKDQLGLLLLWLLLILIINPVGDFPLNDDWCYGKSVKTLYEEGYLKLYNWGEMTLVGHVYWGFLFTKIFGFSFTVLRWSTLVMGFATILGIYQLCKLVNATRIMALFVAILCMVNPISLSLSFSFMTDVPFFSVTIWAIYFFIKALQTDSWKSILIAVIFCIWALLIRQLALVLPLTWFITILLVKKRNTNTWLKAIIPSVILLFFYFMFSYVMTSQGLIQERYNSKFHLLIETLKNFDLNLLKTIFSYTLICLSYIGFLLAPIHLHYIFSNKFRGYKIWIFIYTAIITGLLITFGKAIPSLDNIWIDFGVGPTTLYDHYGDFVSSPSPKAPQ